MNNEENREMSNNRATRVRATPKKGGNTRTDPAVRVSDCGIFEMLRSHRHPRFNPLEHRTPTHKVSISSRRGRERFLSSFSRTACCQRGRE